MPRKNNAKQDLDEETGLHEASSPATETRAVERAQQADSNDVLKAITSLHTELARVKSDICNKIEAEIYEAKYTLRGEIATLRTENDTAISALNTQIGAQNQALKELADAANDTSDTIQELEDKVKKLSGQVEALTEKCIDLEGRSKRQNLRVAGIKEGSENGQKPREFVAQLLKEVLNLADAPVIDRAHRALRKRPGSDEPPRHFIARLHYCHAYEDIMQKAMSTRDLTYRGQRMLIFRDLPPEVARRRAAFTPARKILRDKPGVKFGLLYPAKLRVTHNGSERLFTDPEEARQYATRHFGSSE